MMLHSIWSDAARNGMRTLHLRSQQKSVNKNTSYLIPDNPTEQLEICHTLLAIRRLEAARMRCREMRRAVTTAMNGGQP
jgi:hypothetical protein